MAELEMKIGTSARELEEVQKLRYKVFHIEIKGVTPQTTGRDHDPLDEVCEHLLIMDKERAEIVGTYRMLTGAVAAQNFGFY